MRCVLRIALLTLLLPLPLRAQSVVALENQKPGTTEWRIAKPALDHEIEGYASLTSVPRGGSILIYVNTGDPTYTMDVFRTGWYGGLGARRMLPTISRTGISQPIPSPSGPEKIIECRWTDPYSLQIPRSADATDWASGVYLVKLTGSSGKQSYVSFVVRDDDRVAALFFQCSVTTYQAYNAWGGKSLYPFNSTDQDPSRKVSFNRPYSITQGLGAGEFLNDGGWEYNMLRWLEKEGYDVSYGTNIDVHESPSILSGRKAFLSVGHDEYWTWEMRTNVIAARDRGINLGYFGGNACYWQIRLEPSAVDGARDRTEVGYKEYVFAEDPVYLDGDPKNDYLVTTKWHRWPLLIPEEEFIGVTFIHDGINTDIVVANASHWVFAGTGLRNGDHLPGLLGYEVDHMTDFTPKNIELLAQSPFTSADGPGHSDMTIYRADSGALVFAAGSIQWAWGLDDFNAPGARTSRLNPAAQQITRNILNRFENGPAPARRRVAGR